MKILYVDTASDKLYIALIGEDKVISHREESRLNHSVMLLPVLDALLRENSMTLDDFDYFAANTGPGSFTGIRIGVTTVNAFGFTKGKKIIPVTSFMPFAYNGSRAEVFALDARHGNYYTARVSGENFTYEVMTGEEARAADAEFINPDECTDEGVKRAVLSRIGDACDMIAPFYLRESEAERNENQTR